LLQVELGLRLLELLELTDEPVEVVWCVLVGLPLPQFQRNQLDDSQRRILAKARVLLRFGRFAWREALRWYSNQQARWRVYRIDPGSPLDHPVQREPNGPAYATNRITIFDQVLTDPVQYKEKSLRMASPGRLTFRTTRQKPRTVTVDLDADLVAAATQTPIPQLDTTRRTRQPIEVTFEQLQQTADTLDYRMNVRNSTTTPGIWRTLLEQVIRWRRIDSDGKLSLPNSNPIRWQGMLHLAGMVGAGKSTLMKLLAAHGALTGQCRTTLVVGDTITAINLADELNRLLADSDSPVAVPLVGRTTRSNHLQRLYQSSDFRPDHWGLRWLDTRCPVQGLVVDSDPLQPGDEPCERLQAGAAENPGPPLICPLFAVCPSRRLYHDLPSAMIWITTPGAMAMSRLPTPVDKRHMMLAEVIYHQSDLVIFDEVDTVQQWFDNVYATDQWLLDGGSGVLDLLHLQTVQFMNRGFQISRQGQRWLTAEQSARQVADQICSLLRENSVLKEWLGDRYFTAHRLFYDLSRRLNLPSDATEQNSHHPTLRDFDEFRRDSFLTPTTAQFGSDSISQLHVIADQILARAGSLVDEQRVKALCQRWLRDHVSQINQVEAKLAADLAAWQARQTTGAATRQRGWNVPPPDNLETLAVRLELAISVAILEEMIRQTFDRWQHAPLYVTGQIDASNRLSRIPADLIGVLPTSPTGSLFGFQYLEETAGNPDSPNAEQFPLKLRRFSAFQYQNVGRWLVQHFHELLHDLGYPGPNVLAMSGTSWLPDSAAWHFSVEPEAVLEATPASQRAIRASELSFRPLRDSNGHPIFVSGSGQLAANLIEMGRLLAAWPSPQQSFLQQELDTLEALAAAQPQLWQDRVRLLLFVNSYDQVQSVTRAILSQRPDWRDETYSLVRRLGAKHSEGWQWVRLDGQELVRADVEQFGRRRGRMLIAPLQAVGRGYNILNQDNVAAFGSVLFLTRPMPHPFDMQARAQWLNDRAQRKGSDLTDALWREPANIHQQAEAMRFWAHREWDTYDDAGQFRYLSPERKDDLAASLAGVIIQAGGRLLRGGVPFRAFFMDAAWAPQTAAGHEPDTPATSLLLRIQKLLNQYSQTPVGQVLYGPLAEAFNKLAGVPATPAATSERQ
jgi:hypothetical protein